MARGGNGAVASVDDCELDDCELDDCELDDCEFEWCVFVVASVDDCVVVGWLFGGQISLTAEAPPIRLTSPAAMTLFVRVGAITNLMPLAIQEDSVGVKVSVGAVFAVGVLLGAAGGGGVFTGVVLLGEGRGGSSGIFGNSGRGVLVLIPGPLLATGSSWILLTSLIPEPPS